MKRFVHPYRYAISDILATVLVWIIIISGAVFSDLSWPLSGFEVLTDGIFYVLFWTGIFFLTGAYTNIYYKSRLLELFKTLFLSLAGSIPVYLLLHFLYNPSADDPRFDQYLLLASIQFFVTYAFRYILLLKTHRQLQRGDIWFNTLVIGHYREVEDLHEELENYREKSGYKIVGYTPPVNEEGISDSIPCLGDITSLAGVIDNHHISEVIITPPHRDENMMEEIIRQLSLKRVNVRMPPAKVDILSGRLRTSNVMGIPLILVDTGIWQSWELKVKRIMDIVISFICLIVLSPLFLITALRTRFSSRGSVIYSQERIGYKGKPFLIYKFRSMVVDAEKDTPLLSSDNDPRITRWGKVMRRWRLDELPQFWNILKGEMSLVGPRPERQYFMDIIQKTNPEYLLLLKVKPGLTSWGMVKFGYAQNVEEMIKRMEYDLIYIRNISLFLDIKILIYTMSIIFLGKGK